MPSPTRSITIASQPSARQRAAVAFADKAHASNAQRIEPVDIGERRVVRQQRYAAKTLTEASQHVFQMTRALAITTTANHHSTCDPEHVLLLDLRFR